ncbi:hypothetical protein D915_010459 [Fasciola hepatica]|uniref:Uncharacterized protein n=1 Tax=Fasciola hepatica TaxID=6192 RepID=A0A4E0QWI8_FASHE|nr:hypothetical protein D915_010459 [Fasciola hepatica]
MVCILRPQNARYWQESVTILTLRGDRLEITNSFKYRGSLITAGVGVGEEIRLRVARARAAFANLRHLWRRHDIRLFLKRMVYNATVRIFLPCIIYVYIYYSRRISTLSLESHKWVTVNALKWIRFVSTTGKWSTVGSLPFTRFA